MPISRFSTGTRSTLSPPIITLPASGIDETRDAAQQRGLAAARRPQQAEELPVGKIER